MVNVGWLTNGSEGSEVLTQSGSSLGLCLPAGDTIEKAKARTRAVGRKLKDVQELPVGEASALLPSTVMEDDAEAGEGDSA